MDASYTDHVSFPAKAKNDTSKSRVAANTIDFMNQSCVAIVLDTIKPVAR
jgi:hypothetical protein